MTWHTTPHRGVRYREHNSRIYEGEKDRYYAIRCKVGGKDIERGLGWASAGITPETACGELEKLRASFRDCATAETTVRRRKPTILFSRFWEREYLPFIVKNKAPSSVAIEKGFYANWLEPNFGSLPLNRLSVDRLDSLMADVLETKRSPRTARYILSVVSQIWNLALERHYDLPKNPCQRVTITTAATGGLRIPRSEELRKIMGVLAYRNRDLHDAVALALFCGLTPFEMFHLCWADVNLARGSITVRESGSRRDRTVYLPASINDMLARRNWESFSRSGGMQLTDYLFPRARNIRREWFSRAFAHIAREEGWNPEDTPRHARITLATFRHVYSIWLITGGLGLSAVADLMGHKTISLLQKYERFAPSPEGLCRSVLDGEWKKLFEPHS